MIPDTWNNKYIRNYFSVFLKIFSIKVYIWKTYPVARCSSPRPVFTGGVMCCEGSELTDISVMNETCWKNLYMLGYHHMIRNGHLNTDRMVLARPKSYEMLSIIFLLTYYYYLLHLGLHPVAVVRTLHNYNICYKAVL